MNSDNDNSESCIYIDVDSKNNSSIIQFDISKSQSNNSFANQMSFFCKTDEKDNKNKINKIFCKYCNKPPIIDFNEDNSSINVSCDHKEYINMSQDNFEEHFLDEELDKELVSIQNYNQIKADSYCTCDLHENKKFEYFCRDCKDNLCAECFTKSKNHSNHKLIDFNSNEFRKIIKEIQEKNHSLSNSYSIDPKLKNYNKYLDIINKILELNDSYPCYNFYASINNIYKFIKNYSKIDVKEIIK